jgi:PTS system mannose-specific IIB component
VTPIYRVDNRLVHGQIIATWMPTHRLQRLVIVSDSVPQNQLQMTMFRMAIPHQMGFDAFAVKEGAAWLAGRGFGMDRTMVLLETVSDAARLFESGHPFPELNIGNVHHTAGSTHVTNAVYLSRADLDLLERFARRGVRVEVRTLPTEAPIGLDEIRTMEGGH